MLLARFEQKQQQQLQQQQQQQQLQKSFVLHKPNMIKYLLNDATPEQRKVLLLRTNYIQILF